MNTCTQRLGRLKPVALREAWPSESLNFTPWLGQAENLALLGEAVGMDLELEANEQPVGPFRADILCRNATDDSWVYAGLKKGTMSPRSLMGDQRVRMKMAQECVDCAETDHLCLDHIVPLHRGGADTGDNSVSV
jgi:hypothetical protein